MNKPKLILSSAYAAIVAVVFAVGVTIWAELAAPLKDWLKGLSGHHWTSKSILSVLLFAVVAAIIYLLPYERVEDHVKKSLNLLLIFIVLGTIAIATFYTGHHFHLF